MMRKITVWPVVLITGLGILIWQGLPFLAATLPNRVKQRLPHEALVLLQTPLPTALPAPAGTAVTASIRITLPPLPVIPTPTHAIRPPTATPAATPVPPSALIMGIANQPQKFNNCGPANLNIVLTFHGVETTQLDIAAILKPNPDDRNVSPEELAAYINAYTPLHAAVYSGGDLGHLKRFIAAGFPIIVEKGLRPSEQEGWMGHYLTIYGYDDAEQTFTSMDTLLGPWDGSGRSDSYAAMAEFWGHFNYTFVLVYPAERETAVAHILTPALTDPLAMWQRAAYIAQNEIDTNPDNAFAWFNLGTSLTHLSQLTNEAVYHQNAAAAFDHARTLGLPWRMLWYQFEMYEAYLRNGRYQDILTLAATTQTIEEALLYKGHALRATGDEAAAQTAYQQALQLHPGFPPAQRALSENVESSD